jgi:RNA polymerase sigma-70 factor (ECF subfamily)
MEELASLLEEHRPRLLAAFRRRLSPAVTRRVALEDVLGEAFLKARLRWRAFREQSGLTAYAWLYRMTRDCLIEVLRREGRECRAPEREVSWPEGSSVQVQLRLFAQGPSPSSVAARNEQAEKAQQALDMLRPEEREVLWMRHHDQLSFREIGAILDVTTTGAQMRYARALEKLRGLCLGRRD